MRKTMKRQNKKVRKQLIKRTKTVSTKRKQFIKRRKTVNTNRKTCGGEGEDTVYGFTTGEINDFLELDTTQELIDSTIGVDSTIVVDPPFVADVHVDIRRIYTEIYNKNILDEEINKAELKRRKTIFYAALFIIVFRKKLKLNERVQMIISKLKLELTYVETLFYDPGFLGKQFMTDKISTADVKATVKRFIVFIDSHPDLKRDLYYRDGKENIHDTDFT
jgi:hypothetical protein